MAHTPGPWQTDCVLAENEALHDIVLGYDVPGAGCPIIVASVSWDEERDEPITLEQANANARLIATAPDLLAKLDAVQCYCPVHVQDEIRALIGKAKGTIKKDQPQYHAVNIAGQRAHTTGDFDACVQWAFDNLGKNFTILTTRNGEPVIERDSANLVDIKARGQ